MQTSPSKKNREIKASPVTWTKKRNVREENDLKKEVEKRRGRGWRVVVVERGEGGWDGCCYCV